MAAKSEVYPHPTSAEFRGQNNSCWRKEMSASYLQDEPNVHWLRLLLQEAEMALQDQSLRVVLIFFLAIWATICASLAIGFALGRLTVSL